MNVGVLRTRDDPIILFIAAIKSATVPLNYWLYGTNKRYPLPIIKWCGCVGLNLVHNNNDDCLSYCKLPSGNAGLEPESNPVFPTIAYESKDWSYCEPGFSIRGGFDIRAQIHTSQCTQILLIQQMAYVGICVDLCMHVGPPLAYHGFVYSQREGKARVYLYTIHCLNSFYM